MRIPPGLPPPVLTTQTSRPPSAATASATSRGRVARDRQVAGERRGGTDCLAGFLGTLEVAADDGDGRALCGERRGDGPAEPGRRTEDERPCAVETEIHQFPSHTVRLTV